LNKPAVSSIEIQDFALWDKMKARRVPLSFDLEITARCNNDCRHCYINLPAGDRVAQANELGAAEIGDIADQAVALGAMWCLITGASALRLHQRLPGQPGARAAVPALSATGH